MQDTIIGLSQITSPLFFLLAKINEFKWIDEFYKNFDHKEKLSTTPILQGTNWSFPFHIHIIMSY